MTPHPTAGAAAHAPLSTALTDLVGCRHPIVQTGMGWVAGPRLVSATANAGGLGILASATMSLERLAAAIAEVRARTGAPFGVNLRADAADAPDRVDLLIRKRVRVASFALAPTPELIARLKDAGIAVIPSVGAPRHAGRSRRGARTPYSYRAVKAAGTPARSPPPSSSPRSSTRSTSRWSRRAASSTVAASSPRSPTVPPASRWAPASC